MAMRWRTVCVLLCTLLAPAAAAEPAAQPVRLYAEADFSIYERALVTLANLRLLDGQPEEAEKLLLRIIEQPPPHTVASLVYYHIFRIRRHLLNDAAGAMAAAASVRSPYMARVLYELIGALEKEGNWRAAMDVLLDLLPRIQHAETRIEVAERLLLEATRSADNRLLEEACNAIIQRIDAAEARAVAEIRRQERQRLLDAQAAGREPAPRTTAAPPEGGKQ